MPPSLSSLGARFARVFGSRSNARLWIQHGVLAVVTYLPLLATAPGRVAADTKTYLYLDPSRLLAKAPWMWDQSVGFGTVTHQTIGYLFPMGPWFWLFERVGAPDWVAQRLWLATILFAAGAGVLFLIRTLAAHREDPVPSAIEGTVALTAALVYTLTPYSLQYASRFSALLLPWAGLPWLVGLAQRSLRRGGWRHPALFALVVTTIGSVNATALLLVGLGPVIWIVFAAFVHREVTPRAAGATVLRIGVLTTACSLWWVAGLLVQGGYGIDVLRYSETLAAVAGKSLASEVLRGLGYWFFYGGDKIGPWLEQGPRYMRVVWLMAASFAIPVVAFTSVAIFRWRYRAFVVVLMLFGTAVSVGAHPYEDPAPAGALFKGLAEGTGLLMAMRSTPRAAPLLILGFALAVFGGLTALVRRKPESGRVAIALVIVIAIVAMQPLFTGQFLSANLLREEDIPSYWRDAAAYLDSRPHSTRALELPGMDFAAYRWGQTIDPVTPGLMDRPYAARELIPQGSSYTADLLNALDRRLQEGIFDPRAIAPIARLMGVGDVVLRSDLEYERYRTPRPRQTWAMFLPSPPGLGAPTTFGAPRPNRSIERLPLQDVLELTTPPDAPHPPPVAVFPVEDATSVVGAKRVQRPLIVSGDGEGLVHAAARGLLGKDDLVLYAGALANRPEQILEAIDAGTRLIVTDSNRRRARQWRSLFDVYGYTEARGARPLREDPADNRLPLFPDAGEDSFTTARYAGVEDITATSYGNRIAYTPESRASNAFDGDTDTAWRAGDFDDTVGERIEITLKSPVRVDAIEVVQPIIGAKNRFITEVEVRLDGESAGTFELDDSSRTAKGQKLPVDRSFRRLSIEVSGDNFGRRDSYKGLSPVGFAEIRIPGVEVEEVIDLPRDILGIAGDRSARSELNLLLERARLNPLLTTRQDEEPAMVRGFTLPTRRSFTVNAEARLSAFAPGDFIDYLLGIPSARDGGISVTTSSALLASLADRGSAALDGDPKTAWRTGFRKEDIVGSWIDVEVPAPTTVDRLDLVLVADAKHTLPTRLRIESGGATRRVAVPDIKRSENVNATLTVPVKFAPLQGTRFRVVIEEVDPVFSIDYFDEVPAMRPVGVAELGLPGIRRPAPAAEFDTGCRGDLLFVDDKPVLVRVRGSLADAEARRPLGIELCTDDKRLNILGGEHVLRTGPGKVTGIDIDALHLQSAPFRRAPQTADAPAESAAPVVDIVRQGRTSFDVKVRNATEPFWLILRQSHNRGWKATADGIGDLGEPELVDGFANGWLVDPGRTGDLQIQLDWTPQRWVWLSLGASALAVLACIGIVAFTAGVRRRAHAIGRRALAPSPSFRSPSRAANQIAGRRSLVVCGLVCGLIAWLLAGLFVGIVVGAAVVAALALGKRARLLLCAGAVCAVVAAASLIIGYVAISGPPPSNFTWPTYFEQAHVLAWIGVLLMTSDVVVGWFTRDVGDPPLP